MCGLAGELRFDQQPADLAAIERITHHLAPRGPDAWGFHAQGPIALGHRRLKIMDLSDGSAQPMIDSQLGLSLAFNGAIYNFRNCVPNLKRWVTPSTPVATPKCCSRATTPGAKRCCRSSMACSRLPFGNATPNACSSPATVSA